VFSFSFTSYLVVVQAQLQRYVAYPGTDLKLNDLWIAKVLGLQKVGSELCTRPVNNEVLPFLKD
jgi:hypothetical protein